MKKLFKKHLITFSILMLGMVLVLGASVPKIFETIQLTGDLIFDNSGDIVLDDSANDIVFKENGNILMTIKGDDGQIVGADITEGTYVSGSSNLIIGAESAATSTVSGMTIVGATDGYSGIYCADGAGAGNYAGIIRYFHTSDRMELLTSAATKGLYIEGDGTLNVALTANYEDLVLSDDDLPNKAYTDAIAPLTTKGDLLTYTTTNARLAVGTDGQVLEADSSEASGLKWVDASASGIGSLLSKTADYTVTTSENNVMVYLARTTTADKTFTMYALTGAATNNVYFKNVSDYLLTIKGTQSGTDAVEAGTTATVITATAHGFSAGEVLNMTSGDESGETRRITSVTTDTITLESALSGTPSATETFEVVEAIDGKYSIILGKYETLNLIDATTEWFKVN